MKTFAIRSFANPYRHVVFAEPVRRRPLNLGDRPRATPPIVRLPQAAPRSCDDQITEDDGFLGWLFRQHELKARDYRPASLRRRLPACLRALRVESTDGARQLLRRQPHLVRVALEALLLGVTEFFRDRPVFERLEEHLPELVSDVPNDRPLRVWSAGCSDGAELGSIAMLLSEMNVLHRCELLGTDCREDAIVRAAAGTFAPTAAAGVSARRLHHYFEPADLQSGVDERPLRVRRSIRERIAWRRGDVLRDVEPGRWDMILCRNMAMYLQPAVAEGLWRRLALALVPGGLLVLGKAERPTGAAAMLTQLGPCVYRRGGEL